MIGPLTLTASPPRRCFAAGVLVLAGVVAAWSGLSAPSGAGLWRLPLVGIGVGAAWLAVGLWQASGRAIELTEAGLRDSDGRWLARIDQIASVDRSTFAFKPSNGFVVQLTEPLEAAWAPGLWWRLGRRVGVGGVTSPGMGRLMADILAAYLAERADRPDDRDDRDDRA